jgi:hypothetical protein
METGIGIVLEGFWEFSTIKNKLALFKLQVRTEVGKFYFMTDVLEMLIQ